MSNLNKCCFIGRLTKDPELKVLTSKKPVASFTIAVNGIEKGNAEFINCVAWEKLADICADYLVKGKLVYIEGRYKTSSWEKDGQRHYKTEIIVYYMEMLGSKADGQAPTEKHHDDDDVPF